MTIDLYGIPNCDTVKKARRWLDDADVRYGFHDYKKEGVDPERLAAWADTAGWDALLNRAGTTFRKLPDADRAGIDRDRALALMVTHPSLIRRPVIEHDGGLTIGFRPDEYGRLFGWRSA